MRVPTLAVAALTGGILAGAAAVGDAAPPWKSLVPFRKSQTVAADGPLELSEDHGPWLILAANFAGEGAEQQATALVRELRTRHGLRAYLHRQEYDFTQPVRGLSVDKYTGQPAKMKYANATRYEGIAVLVGDFVAVEDQRLQDALEWIKQARPEALGGAAGTNNQPTSQFYAGLRRLQRLMNGDPEKKSKGPMGNAFATRNPLLPDDQLAASPVDDFVVQLNKGVQHSLLDNPGRFTVRVATFTGFDTINQREIARLEQAGQVTDKLEIAAQRAHQLTQALRKQGIPAWEFHDRNESIVTVGGFESDGTELPDGAVEIDPAILQIIRTYQARRQPLPNGREVGLTPKSMNGIPFDVQPLPIPVPRKSLAADYAQGRSLLR